MKRFILILFILILQTISLKANEGSVICIHGFFRSCRCMIPMGNAIQNQGLRVFLWDYPSRKMTIEQHAENLVEVLNAIAIEKPGEPIHFVTHSLGGILVRAAVNHPKCPIEARNGKAVLLAPPNEGSTLARDFSKYPPIKWLFGKKTGRQLLHYSPEEMAQFGEFPDTMKVLVIAGYKGNRFLLDEPNDGKVTVAETRLPTPHSHYLLKVSHHWIMTSRESIHIAKSFLLGLQS